MSAKFNTRIFRESMKLSNKRISSQRCSVSICKKLISSKRTLFSLNFKYSCNADITSWFKPTLLFLFPLPSQTLTIPFIRSISWSVRFDISIARKPVLTINITNVIERTLLKFVLGDLSMWSNSCIYWVCVKTVNPLKS